MEKDVKEEKEKCFNNVKLWKHKLEEAKQQLAYWELQAEAMLTLSTRLMLDGFEKGK